MPERLLSGLRKFRSERFPEIRDLFQRLVEEGQRPGVLFIGCSDSRVVPDLLTDTGPGDLFVVRNVGSFVPPFDSDVHHATAAAVEYAVSVLEVEDIVVCGHTHCGAVRSLFDPPDPSNPHLREWLDLSREAVPPEHAGGGAEGATGAGPEAGAPGSPAAPSREALRSAEERSVALQLSRLAEYPMVRERMEAGRLNLEGWLYVLEDGEVWILDVERGEFVRADEWKRAG